MGAEEEAAIVQLGEPREDVGAVTQSRYRYQWECTAAACIAMLVEEDIIGITCEWHEDYVISYTQRRLELVSIKHREPDRGPWSLDELCGAGGLAHLFDRWQSADDRTTCRISTNGGLKPGAREARELAEACSRAYSGDELAQQKLDDYSASIACLISDIRLGRRKPKRPRLSKPRAAPAPLPAGAEQLQLELFPTADSDPLQQEVRRFLAVLQIEYGLPGRSHIGSHNVMNVLKPTLDSLGRDSSNAEAYYKAMLELIERANTDNDSRPRSMTAYLADPDRLARDRVVREIVGRRTLTPHDVRACLSSQSIGGVRLTGAAFDGHPEAVEDASTSRLVRKLRAGGIGPTGISSAMRLRGAWLAAWAELRTGLPGDAAELADLKARVLHLASMVEDEVRGTGNYGAAMNRRLSEVLRPSALGRSLPIVLDPLHILGLAYELCDECQIWFSDPSALQG